MSERSRLAFLGTPLRLRAWVLAAIVAALLLPPALRSHGHLETAYPLPLTALVVVGLSILNIEIGRLLEGGVTASQRPHKGLSGWAFAAALLLPTWTLAPIVAVTYGHAWWRGLRVTPWKWVGSAAYVVLAALAAGLSARAVLGTETNLMAGDGARGLIAALAGAAAFLGAETVLFHGSAYLNHEADEVWLRRTLASGSFYVTEASVLLVGGLSAAMWTGGPWFVLLLFPVYVLTQRAALHEPLRERAETDDKTGVLRYESWRVAAMALADRCRRHDSPACVLFADLDHFKQYNDRWGHLAGDEALVAVAAAIRGQLRPDDLLGRFGGEEFCVFLGDVDEEQGQVIAERIRCAVAAAPVPGATGVTISLGIAALPDGNEHGFADALLAADHALFRAKDGGRDRSALSRVGS